MRSPSTSSATSISARATPSSASPTTKSPCPRPHRDEGRSMRDPSLTPISGPASQPDAPRPRTRLGRMIRDPLLHFGLIGIALFGFYRVLDPSADGPEEDQI